MDSAPLGFPLLGQMQLGQVLFMPPNVAGWDWGKAWINTNTLLTRYNLAGSLTKGSAGETMTKSAMMQDGKGSAILQRMVGRDRSKGPDYEDIADRSDREDIEALVGELIDRFFCVEVPSKARNSFIAYANAKKGVSFTDKEMGELCHLMISTPYYQIC